MWAWRLTLIAGYIAVVLATRSDISSSVTEAFRDSNADASVHWDTLLHHDIIQSMNLDLAQLLPLLRVSKSTRHAVLPFTAPLSSTVQKHLVNACGKQTLRKLFRSVFLGITWPIHRLSSNCYASIASFCQRHQNHFTYPISMTITYQDIPYSEGLLNFVKYCPESIHISGHRNNNDSALIVKHLLKSRVRKIILDNLMDDPLDALSHVLMTTSIQEVILKDIPFGKAMNFTTLAQSLPHSNVSTLILENVPVNKTMLDHFYKGIATSRITKLSLLNCQFVNFDKLFHLIPNSRIQDFSIREKTINNTSLAKVLPNAHRLRKLSLDITRSVGLNHLTMLLSPSIRELAIKTTYIARPSFENLASLLVSKSIVNLTLAPTKYSWEGFDYLIRNGLNGSDVVSLNFSGLALNNITKMELLSSVLPHMPQLRYLTLSHCQIDSAGMESLASYLPKTSITHLDLSSNADPYPTTDAILDILPSTSVSSLTIQSGEISNESGVKFALSLPSTHLTQLDLSHNNLGLEFIYALSKSLSKSTLRHLSIQNNMFTETGILFFMTSLPYRFRSSSSSLSSRSSPHDHHVSSRFGKKAVGALEYIDIRGHHLSDDALEFVARKACKRDIKSIFVSSSMMRSDKAHEYVVERYPLAFDYDEYRKVWE